MRAFSIARKTLLENLREPQLLGIFLIFPSLLVMFYFISYGGMSSGISNYLTLLVLDQDSGPQGQALVEHLSAAQFDGKPVFTVRQVNGRQAAGVDLLENKAAMLLVIPSNFSQTLDQAGVLAPVEIELHGDPGSDMFVFARGFLEGEVDSFADAATNQPQEIAMNWEFVTNTGKMSDFQFGVAGTLVFGIMFGIVTAAMVLVREDVNGTLKRLCLSRATPGDVLGGVVIAIMVESAVQVPLTFGIALLMGFDSPGNLLVAMLIGMGLSLSACGMGFLTACFAKNDGEAANIGSLIMMPLVFLSGAVFPIPPMEVFRLGGRVISLYDIFPTAHAAEAMRRVLIFGDGAGDVLFELIAMLVLSLAYLAFGVWLYGRLRLRKA